VEITKPEIAEESASDRKEKTQQENTALKRFKECRWHKNQNVGASYCSHGEVVPFTGKNGFKPQAWCPECSFFKTKRAITQQQVDHH